MKRIKSFLAAFLVALLSAALIIPIAACGPDGSAEGSNVINITSKGGMALKSVAVEVFNGSSSLGKKETNDEGKVSYNLENGTDYSVVLSNVPQGYEYEDSYTFNGTEKNYYIRLNSHVIENGTQTKTYAIGDVMYDFEQTYYYNTPDGIQSKKVKLSDVLKEKNTVLINFFYADCYWCNQEYPALREAYLEYSDKLEILAINDYSNESLSAVTTLVQKDDVPYLMCKDTANVGRWFDKTGWPTSYIIDRYGIVCDATQTQIQKSYWTDLFEKYTSDNYEQVVNPDGGGNEVFVPDKPEDFNVSMPSTQTLNEKINKTGKNVTFSEDTTLTDEGGKYCWPWDLTADQTAIYPTNSGHNGTLGVIYAQINLNANEVFAFDYKLSTFANNDYFYVSIDSRSGTGRQITMESGVKDWRTGFAYVALEAGQHEICFSYFRSTANTSLSVEDKVYINNLRIMNIDEMNAELTSRGETVEIPYFATREYSSAEKRFTVIENVYVADDGYYHLGTKATAKANDPYLLLDLTHSTPFFGSNSDNIYNLYNERVRQSGAMRLGGKDYTNDFASYISFSGNSDYKGLIPVTESTQKVLTALYNNEIPSNAPYYDKTGKGWLQFCVAYRQYGVQQKTLTDPVKGLAYFSAFDDTKESTPDYPTFKQVPVGEGQFIFEDGKYIDVEGSSRASEGNYDLNDNINTVHFDRIIMPLGYMYKFVPEHTGVYRFQGVNCYYVNEATGTTVIDDEETDGALYDGSLNVSHIYASPIAESGPDRYFRREDYSSFRINHYLEQGKTYYLSVHFRVVETTGDFAFRADYLGESYDYLHQCTSDFYIPDENSKLHLNTYVDAVLDPESGYYVDKNHGGYVYLDMTDPTFLFSSFTVEQILNDKVSTAQFTFDIAKETYTYKDPATGNDVTVDISLDLEERYGSAENIPEALKGLEIKDYTDRMKYYLAESKKVSEDDMLYGLVPVNQELYEILQLFNAKFFGYDDDNEWLKACWFVDKLGPAA